MAYQPQSWHLPRPTIPYELYNLINTETKDLRKTVNKTGFRTDDLLEISSKYRKERIEIYEQRWGVQEPRVEDFSSVYEARGKEKERGVIELNLSTN